MLSTIYSIFELSIIILIILHVVISKRISGNNQHNNILNIKIRIVIDIILSVAFLINTSIAILIKESEIFIVISIVATILWESNVDSGVRSLRILKEKLYCTNND